MEREVGYAKPLGANSLAHGGLGLNPHCLVDSYVGVGSYSYFLYKADPFPRLYS